MEILELTQLYKEIKCNIEKVIVGKSGIVDLVLTCLISGGHVLLEDVPGTGKTMLAKAVARTFDADFKRIQFTPDLLPTDLIGLNTYNPKTGDFAFRKGALFTNILLADEINRATPRTQSSLLESMEEKQITSDGNTMALEPPYFVIATQNPIETQGTFPLPEAQLDRFLMCVSIGYPEKADGINVIKRFIAQSPLETLRPVCGKKALLEMMEAVKTVYVHDDIIAYVIDIAERTRNHEAVTLGVSTRGALLLVKAAQTRAAVSGRAFVTPDDIKLLAQHVLGHRLIIRGGLKNRGAAVRSVLNEVLDTVAVPTENWEFAR